MREPSAPPADAASSAEEATTDPPDHGFVTQARILVVVGTWIVGASLGYGLLTHEWAGTTMLSGAGILVLTIAAYLVWPRHWHDHPPGSDASPQPLDPPAAASEEPWFPVASGWPFCLGLGLTLLGNGLLLGSWLLAPATGFTVLAIVGFVAQSRWRA